MKKFIISLIIIMFCSLLYFSANEVTAYAFQLTPFIPTNTPTTQPTSTPTISIIPWKSPTPTPTKTPTPTATYDWDCRLRYCTPTPVTGNS